MADTEQAVAYDFDVKRTVERITSTDADISREIHLEHQSVFDADLQRTILKYVYDFRGMTVDDTDISFSNLTDVSLKNGTYKMTLLDFNGQGTGFEPGRLITSEKDFSNDKHTIKGIASVNNKGNIIYTLTVTSKSDAGGSAGGGDKTTA